MNTTREKDTVLFTPFWPLCLMAVSLALFLGWQVTTAARQYIALLRLADQQTLLTGQAAQAEGKLQAMMMELLKLSQTDADAKAIVNKYNVKFNPAQPLVLPSDAALPQPKSNLKENAGVTPKPMANKTGAAE
jgi:hypothetical protein